MARYQYATNIWTDDTTHGSPAMPVRVVYSYTPGTPETGAYYMAPPEGYDPGSPAELDVTEIWLEPKDGEPCVVASGSALWNWLVADLEGALEAHARDAIEADRDHAAEMRRAG